MKIVNTLKYTSRSWPRHIWNVTSRSWPRHIWNVTSHSWPRHIWNVTSRSWPRHIWNVLSTRSLFEYNRRNITAFNETGSGVSNIWILWFSVSFCLFIWRFCWTFPYDVLYLEWKWVEEDWELGNFNISAGK